MISVTLYNVNKFCCKYYGQRNIETFPYFFKTNPSIHFSLNNTHIRIWLCINFIQITPKVLHSRIRPYNQRPPFHRIQTPLFNHRRPIHHPNTNHQKPTDHTTQHLRQHTRAVSLSHCFLFAI